MQRRHFLSLAGLFALPLQLFANTRSRTPSQTEGPFYPVKAIPVRHELIANPESLLGEAIQLSGRVVNTQGQPLAGIRVEIWQCDGQGLYDHPRQSQTERFDQHFLGFGAQLTDREGRYRFHTLYPVPYTGPPHIHAKLWQGDRELLTTQLYLQGQTGAHEWFSAGREHLQIAPQRDAHNQWQASFEFVV
ncbi:MAG: hypothetical protein R3E89_13295 [Thiolinea sp.]